MQTSRVFAQRVTLNVSYVTIMLCVITVIN